MNSEILSKEVQRFITDHLTSDIHTILLKKSPFPTVSSKEVVEQIESKSKAKQKLPTWFHTEHIYYPNKRNLSQTSSETTAAYKASLLQGSTIADITGGLGVDSFAFSKKIEHVTHVEQNENLSRIANHNFKQLGIKNIDFIIDDGLSFLQKSQKVFDWIYIDPSRRDKEQKRVFYLSDCEPDVTEQMDFLFSKAKNILLKTGPLLDLNNGLNQLKQVKEIHIVAVSNDVKEVLWILEKNYNDAPLIKTVNFKNDTSQNFQFRLQDEQQTSAVYSQPKKYLYEPNAAILKSGAFQYIGTYYTLLKLHPNSHLYTSTDLISFPGRVFNVLDVLDYSKKAVKNLKLKKANISIRNFPDTVVQIRKKLNLKDGGSSYLFCTTAINEKLLLLNCTQIFEERI